jgi:hypothetical protein
MLLKVIAVIAIFAMLALITGVLLRLNRSLLLIGSRRAKTSRRAVQAGLFNNAGAAMA